MDEDLEKAIDMAGREKVLKMAIDEGWQAGDSIPKWVWWQICGQLMNKQLPR